MEWERVLPFFTFLKCSEAVYACVCVCEGCEGGVLHGLPFLIPGLINSHSAKASPLTRRGMCGGRN